MPTDDCGIAAGTYDPVTQQCSAPTVKADGTPCNDYNTQTTNGVCDSGTCQGCPIATTPDVGLTGPEMKQLQTLLESYGYDVGDIDGILGAKTRLAIQDVQQRLGLPADAWPTPALLNQL